MKKENQYLEALERARNGSSLKNDLAVKLAFQNRGIPEAEIKPRENVLTFDAWRALGRTVKKGEHGVKVLTIVEYEEQAKNPEQALSPRRKTAPRRTTVFHVSQTKTLTASEPPGSSSEQ